MPVGTSAGATAAQRRELDRVRLSSFASIAKISTLLAIALSAVSGAKWRSRSYRRGRRAVPPTPHLLAAAAAGAAPPRRAARLLRLPEAARDGQSASSCEAGGRATPRVAIFSGGGAWRRM